MWCKNCSREVDNEICPFCGKKTEKTVPTEVYWCDNCFTPIIKYANDPVKNICPLCGHKIKYLTTDVRPVFPEERLLIELLIDKPLAFLGSSVWASANRYYINGKVQTIKSSFFDENNVSKIRNRLLDFKSQNNDPNFEEHIEKFCQANRIHLQNITDEAFHFVQNEAKKIPEEQIVISFSGGKDSTVTADVTIRALSDPSIVHIFGDTTLELPFTIDYAKRYRDNNPKAIFKTAKNKEQDFLSVCKDIGPPARLMRWCCSMFKTGPITRVINNLYRDKAILTFYGIRKYESVSRSKYNRVENQADTVKINKQTVAAPIFEWKDSDVWLYILSNKVDFNEAYRLGYDRVGCWCCPNNGMRSQFLSKLYISEKYNKWHDFLIEFAKRIEKPDPEVYINTGKWKARQGGNGIASANDVKIKFANCTTEEHARIYRLTRPISDEFYELFYPLGKVSKELGRKLIHETIILDIKTKTPIISVQPYQQTDFEYAVKIKTMNIANHDRMHQMIGYQIKKYNVCRQCLKCESLCRFGAISIIGGEYHINDEKCHRCKMCVTEKYLESGCMIGRYLRIKD
ncbi:MAG: phosphoadenosine phosphosulfate reductase family protein [Eubacteriaceae bacterium]|nr:phosphoadenosine phosphosulfate reductase family protein [Eubacteriaceae bacterium]